MSPDNRKQTGETTKTIRGREATEVIDKTETIVMTVMTVMTEMTATEDREIEISPPTFPGKKSPIDMISSSLHQPNTTINSLSQPSKLLAFRTFKSNY